MRLARSSRSCCEVRKVKAGNREELVTVKSEVMVPPLRNPSIWICLREMHADDINDNLICCNHILTAVPFRLMLPVAELHTTKLFLQVQGHRENWSTRISAISVQSLMRQIQFLYFRNHHRIISVSLNYIRVLGSSPYLCNYKWS